MKRDRFWRKWILTYSLSELFVIGVATAFGRLILVELSDFISGLPAPVVWSFLILVGVAEGLTIGYLQWRSLSKLVADFGLGSWIAITVVAFTLAWAVIMPPSIFLIAFFTDFALVNRYYSTLYSMLSGMAFGAIISIGQFLVLKRFFNHAFVWVFSNTVSWMVSFLVISYSVSALLATHSFSYNLTVMILACIFSGLMQGVITGSGLHFLMSVKKDHRSASELI